MVRQGNKGGVGRHHHNNAYAFRHNPHSKLTEKINAIVETDICKRFVIFITCTLYTYSQY